VDVRSVKMPAGFGRLRAKGRPLAELAHLKHSIVNVKAEQNCLAHALVIVIAKVTNDPNYKANIQRWNIIRVVQHVLETTGIDLSKGGGYLSSCSLKPIFQNTAPFLRGFAM
jgi:hypothetical protein